MITVRAMGGIHNAAIASRRPRVRNTGLPMSAVMVVAALAAVGCESTPTAKAAPGGGSDTREPAADGGAKPDASSSPATPATPSAGTHANEHTAVDAGDLPRDATPPPAASQFDDAGSTHPADNAPTLQEAMKNYLSWKRRQPEPRAISAEIFGLCRLPTLAEQAFADSLHGKELALLDWVNEPAVQGLAAGGKPAFPVGAAIVKQKLLSIQPGAMVVALGIMVKHAAGYDPAHGDWEFGYWEEAPGLSSGTEAARSCGGCHAGSPTDFVFVDQSWRTQR